MPKISKFPDSVPVTVQQPTGPALPPEVIAKLAPGADMPTQSIITVMPDVPLPEPKSAKKKAKKKANEVSVIPSVIPRLDIDPELAKILFITKEEQLLAIFIQNKRFANKAIEIIKTEWIVLKNTIKPDNIDFYLAREQLIAQILSNRTALGYNKEDTAKILAIQMERIK
jgi:hypothetical protein